MNEPRNPTRLLFHGFFPEGMTVVARSGAGAQALRIVVQRTPVTTKRSDSSRLNE